MTVYVLLSGGENAETFVVGVYKDPGPAKLSMLKSMTLVQRGEVLRWEDGKGNWITLSPFNVRG